MQHVSFISDNEQVCHKWQVFPCAIRRLWLYSSEFFDFLIEIRLFSKITKFYTLGKSVSLHLEDVK